MPSSANGVVVFHSLPDEAVAIELDFEIEDVLLCETITCFRGQNLLLKYLLFHHEVQHIHLCSLHHTQWVGKGEKQHVCTMGMGWDDGVSGPTYRASKQVSKRERSRR